MDGFPTSEFRSRTRRIQEAMRAESLDAIVFASKEEIHYVTGMVTSFWESPTRQMYVIVHRAWATPCVVVPTICKALFERSWIETILSWSCINDELGGIRLLSEALKSCLRIGIMMGLESHLRTPILHLRSLSDAVDGELVDCTSLVQDIRRVKSSAEVSKVRRCCRMVSSAFDTFHRKLNETPLPTPFTEARLVRMMRLCLEEQGVTSIPFLVGTSGMGGYRSIVAGPSERVLREGDVFVMDVGATYDCYYCDFDRNFSIGAPSHKIAEAHALLWETTQRGIEAARPGRTFGDVWSAMMQHLQKNGVDQAYYEGGRMGHGLGLTLTELPSVSKNAATVLEEGIVMTIEPQLDLGNGRTMVHEEVIVVTNTGGEMLSKRAPKEIPVIPAPVAGEWNPLGVLCKRHLKKGFPSCDFSAKLLQDFWSDQESCKIAHANIPNTPLRSLDSIPGIGEVLVKDEGNRMGMKAFKILGVAYAVERMELSKDSVLCTMTDGNHGMAVAKVAKERSLGCVIFVPSNMSPARRRSLEDLGASVVEVKGTYDDAIRTVRREAAAQPRWVLISDTAWEGYTEIPRRIMSGYATIFREIESQRRGCRAITHVFVQAGVGGLAAAACAWIVGRKSPVWSDDTEIIVVEPLDAACFLEAAQEGQPPDSTNPIPGTTNSIMAGLNCGVPSRLTWPIIRDLADGFVAIGDEWGKRSVRTLNRESIVAGESGGAGFGGLLALVEKGWEFRPSDVALVLNTESDTDEQRFLEIVQGPVTRICT